MHSIHKSPYVFWIDVRIEAMAQVGNVTLRAKAFQHPFYELPNLLLWEVKND